MPKNERDLRKLLAKYGAALEGKCGSGHYRIRLNGQLIVASSTSSDRQGLKSTERHLRRAA